MKFYQISWVQFHVLLAVYRLSGFGFRECLLKLLKFGGHLDLGAVGRCCCKLLLILMDPISSGRPLVLLLLCLNGRLFHCGEVGRAFLLRNLGP